MVKDSLTELLCWRLLVSLLNKLLKWLIDYQNLIIQLIISAILPWDKTEARVTHWSFTSVHSCGSRVVYSAHPPFIHIITPLIKPYVDALLYDLFVWTVIQQIWRTPAGMQLWNALMKCKSLQIYQHCIHLYELMWKHVVMEFTVLLFRLQHDFAPQNWPEGFGQCAGWGEFPLEMWKQTFNAGAGPRKKGTFGWREHRRNGEEGQAVRAVACVSRRNQRNLGGNLKIPFNRPSHLEQFLSFLLSVSPFSLQHHHPKFKPPTRSWTLMDPAAPKAQTSALYPWKQLCTSSRAPPLSGEYRDTNKW